jgi:tetratricopeptide (TPR) repeat protein
MSESFDPSSLPSLIVPPVIILLIVLSFRRSVNNEFNNDSLMQKRYKLTFNSSGVRSQRDEDLSNMLWEDFYDLKESEKGFYLYLSPVKALILPKRTFQNDADVVYLRNLFTNKISRDRAKKSSTTKWNIRFLSYGIYLVVVIGSIASTGIFSGDKPEEEYFIKAKAHMKRKQYIESASYCLIALKINPYSDYAYYLLACAQYNMKDYDNACMSIKKSRRLGRLFTPDEMEQFCGE